MSDVINKRNNYMFKVGDKVRVISNKDICGNRIGSIMTIEIIDWLSGCVYFEESPLCNYLSELELLETKKLDKSFRKAGITNGDDLLTEDGTNIFLSWLLKKHAEEFKKDVVDGLLKEKE